LGQELIDPNLGKVSDNILFGALLLFGNIFDDCDEFRVVQKNARLSGWFFFLNERLDKTP
jgi:hypothetical protein